MGEFDQYATERSKKDNIYYSIKADLNKKDGKTPKDKALQMIKHPFLPDIYEDKMQELQYASNKLRVDKELKNMDLL